MLIDTHAHLDFESFDKDREEVIKATYDSGVEKIINIGADMESSRNSVELAKEYDFIWATVGVHPHYAKDISDDDYQELKELASKDKVVAIGEIGLDYHYDNSPRQEQQAAFKKLLGLAKEVNLPVAIHSREAKKDTIEIIKNRGKGLRGVLHCYAYDVETAKEVIDLGFHIAFGGVITFNNASQLREVVKEVPLDRILIETDAPYLTPAPNRGKRNEPKFVRDVAKKIGEIKGVSLEEVAKVTTENANRLFGLK